MTDVTPPLTAAGFDRNIKREQDRVIWTAGAIGKRIGASADFVRETLAKQPGSPVKQIAGRYCAVEADLLAYFRAEPKET